MSSNIEVTFVTSEDSVPFEEIVKRLLLILRSAA